MDPTALRMEKIRVALDATERLAELHARRYIATMAVALTVLGTVAVAWATRQVTESMALVVSAIPSTVFVDQFVRYRALGQLVAQAGQDAQRDIDSLTVTPGRLRTEFSVPCERSARIAG